MLSWFIRRPHLYHQELAELERQYPKFVRCQDAFNKGILAFRGSFEWFKGAENLRTEVIIRYPGDFPYFPPQVYPLIEGAPSNIGALELINFTGDWTRSQYVKNFSVRHQMLDGSLCLFEIEGAAGSHQHIGGVDALSRAAIWLPAATRGRFPSAWDTVQADLDGHYLKLGNVLVGDALYQADLPDRGRFMAIDLHQDNRYPLYAVTHAEGTTNWHSDVPQIIRMEIRIPENVLNLLDNPNELWEQAPKLANGFRGTWYTLDKEPPPLRTVEELAQLIYAGDASPIEKLARDYAFERRTNATLVFALRFPGREGEQWDWLFLALQMREKAEEVPTHNGDRAYILLDAPLDFGHMSREPVGAYKKQDFRRRSLTLRNRNRVPQSLDSMAIGLLGAGALGSTCGDLLGKAGIGSLDVWDFASLDAGNVIRHESPLTFVGIPKAHVMPFMINRHNPYCQVTPHLDSVLKYAPGDGSPLWSRHALLSTIATDTTELAFNQRAVMADTTVYYLRALRSGAAGRLLRVSPGKDACFECLGLYHAECHSEAILIPEALDEVITHECGHAVLASSAADLVVIAGLGVRQFLSDITEPGDVNQWVWTTTGLSGIQGLEAPFSHRRTELPPHPRCPICQRTPVTNIRVSKGLYDRMLGLATVHSPMETGGLLIGRREGDTVHILEITEAGPQAIQTPTLFIRDGAHSQSAFDEALSRLGPHAEYIGEWHSHPNASSQPSNTDLRSLKEISIDTDYLTDCPVMMIVGANRGMPDVRGFSWPQDRDVGPIPARIHIG